MSFLLGMKWNPKPWEFGYGLCPINIRYILELVSLMIILLLYFFISLSVVSLITPGLKKNGDSPFTTLMRCYRIAKEISPLTVIIKNCLNDHLSWNSKISVFWRNVWKKTSTAKLVKYSNLQWKKGPFYLRMGKITITTKWKKQLTEFTTNG